MVTCKGCNEQTDEQLHCILCKRPICDNCRSYGAYIDREYAACKGRCGNRVIAQLRTMTDEQLSKQ